MSADQQPSPYNLLESIQAGIGLFEDKEFASREMEGEEREAMVVEVRAVVEEIRANLNRLRESMEIQEDTDIEPIAEGVAAFFGAIFGRLKRVLEELSFTKSRLFHIGDPGSFIPELRDLHALATSISDEILAVHRDAYEMAQAKKGERRVTPPRVTHTDDVVNNTILRKETPLAASGSYAWSGGWHSPSLKS
ncbi:hypothetical protein HOG48_05905 [Candidatus Peregrinibacteria bacterium]|jgi:hypothetical protein|nr:hypothetical protein [Candidatus Peregrinibacteria bacterium]